MQLERIPRDLNSQHANKELSVICYPTASSLVFGFGAVRNGVAAAARVNAASVVAAELRRGVAGTRWRSCRLRDSSGKYKRQKMTGYTYMRMTVEPDMNDYEIIYRPINTRVSLFKKLPP